MEQRKRQHSDYMALALCEAERAAAEGEAPIGCVIVKDAAVLAAGRNTRENAHTALGHAEINAIQAACEALHSWRLSGCTLYVTLEPCPMCMGAIINARIDRVVFGAYDPKAGCCGTLTDFSRMGFNHSPEIIGGIWELSCAALLQRFFSELR